MHLFKRIIIHFLRFLIKSNFVTSLQLFVFFKTLGLSTRHQNKLKISVINTQDLSGGAANIAYQLSKEIGKELPLKLFVFSKFRVDDWIQKIPEYGSSLFYELLKKHALAKGYIEFTGMHSIMLFKHLFFKDSSIVHIHNLHGEFFSPMLFKKLFKHKKVIWTLHDESFNTGHCSCTLGCEKWKTGCGECPDLSIYPSINFDNTRSVLSLKKEIIHKLNPVIVSPSDWLAERVKISYPKLKNIRVIPNGVDLNIFQPKDKITLRNKYGIKLDARVILFVAEFSTKNPFKGGEIIRELVKDNTLKDFTFLTVGGEQSPIGSNHLIFPYIENQNQLAELYSLCDLMVYPTKADNLPLVVLESMACGTPVVASHIGGIPEIINDTTMGYLIKDYNSIYTFKEKIIHHFSLETKLREEIGVNCRNQIERFFSQEQMVSSYIKLYNEVY